MLALSDEREVSYMTMKHQKSRMELSKLTLPHKSKNEQIKNHIPAHLFFFDSEGTVHKKFVPQGQTENQFTVGVFKTPSTSGLCVATTWMLHHDNTLCHTALFVTQFLTQEEL